MLIPFDALQTLPQTTINNLIRDYLCSQIEDIHFDSLDEQTMNNAIIQCQQALKSAQLVVEYSEQNESIAIRHKDEVSKMKIDQNVNIAV